MFDKVEELLNKEMTKKEFLTKAGLGIFLLLVSPVLISYIFKDKTPDLFIKDNQIFYKNQMIMEVNE
jgi:hypothetical protein